VPNGPLTSKLQHLAIGDEIVVSRKPTGTLVLRDLRPGKNLYLLSTGTGLAPFISLIQDPPPLPNPSPGRGSQPKPAEFVHSVARLVFAHSKIGASFASTSSMIDAGKVSTKRALRAPRSSTRG
jgi:hypothetical protein